ncbi:DUF4907 domain-containing protein [Galbibacter pacificus]|uniref:DUF4907 domain-containing protein n=1 Tax=Galbibacter pacificus TaxID=2996052 RepID=A0ABT6FUZ4_9FLAO|nr:DUF4907 domain-containing protein [Galbibacter pacificus]MDG3583433.1 DUF4907 domain-containing protein [Galbibacter pacificus]MDG3587090.1 DUF4907 domain-containing protein [Galbibacter pacificus]
MKWDKTKIMILAGVCILIFGWFFLSEKQEEKLKYTVIDVNGGYGYEITYKGTRVIRQEYIPAISAKQPFLSKDDAKKTASLVVNRLKNKKAPYLQKEVLDSLQIKIR